MHVYKHFGSVNEMCVCVCVCVQNGWSCLHVASHKGHVDVVKYLCAQGGEKLLMLTSDVSVWIWMGMQGCSA